MLAPPEGLLLRAPAAPRRPKRRKCRLFVIENVAISSSLKSRLDGIRPRPLASLKAVLTLTLTSPARSCPYMTYLFGTSRQTAVGPRSWTHE